mmetsp:Transcript_51028/g.150424  ORF Transcript_51028/g.150424 Transcript_51028/m.150424 type:complete len:217 (-) Transcript_51028:1813-2463(-)
MALACCSAASRTVFCRPSTALACSLRSCFTRASWVVVTLAIWLAWLAFRSSTSFSFFWRISSIRSWWLLPRVSRSSESVTDCFSVRSVTTFLWSAESFATSSSLSWRASSSFLRSSARMASSSASSALLEESAPLESSARRFSRSLISAACASLRRASSERRASSFSSQSLSLEDSAEDISRRSASSSVRCLSTMERESPSSCARILASSSECSRC